MDCSPPGFSVHGVLQARILEWVASSFSRGSSWPRDQIQVPRIAGRRFNLWATREAPNHKVLLIYCHLAYLTYMQGWMNHKLESRLPGEISTTSHTDDTILVAEGKEELEPLADGESGEWKSWLKSQHSKTKITGSGFIISWQIEGEKVEAATDFLFLDFLSFHDHSHEIKRRFGRKAMTNLDKHLIRQAY